MLDDDLLRLRALEKADLTALYRWENISAFWRSSSTLAPYSLRNVMDYLSAYDADPFHAGELRLLLERKADGEPLGLVELYDVEVLHRRANVGILIDPAHQRRSAGLRALTLLKRYCTERLGLHQLLAYIPADNLPSLALFERAGFARTAILPQWLASGSGRVDAVVMQRFLP